MSYAIVSANVAIGNSAGNIHCFRAMPDGNLYVGRDNVNSAGSLIVSGNLTVQGNIFQTSLTNRDVGLGNVIDVLQIAASEKAAANGVATLDGNGLLASAQRFSVTKSQVGLGNVIDTLQIPASEKAAANGVATLDSLGTIPYSQLPESLTSNIGISLNEKGAPNGVATLDENLKLANIHWFTKTDIGLGNVINALQIAASEKAAANGVATLDANGLLTSAQRFSVTKSQVGLGNVIDVLQIAASEKAAANGVATLDANGLLTSAQRFSLTKSQVGLGNVIDVLQIAASQKAVANGVASLDANAKLVSSQLPDILSNISGTTASRVLVTSSTNTLISSNVTTAQLDALASGNASSVNAANITGNLNGDAVFIGDIDANLLVGNVEINLNFNPGTIPGNALYGAVVGNIGNVSAPGFTFLDNVSTGLYRPLANTIGFSTGGTLSAQINTQGLLVNAGSNVLPSLTFSGNSLVGFYLNSNVVTSTTNLQTPSGIVTAMNTSTPAGGHSSIINPIACAWFSAASAGVLTSKVTPSYYADTNNWRGWYGPASQYNFVRTYINLAAGTYTLRFLFVKSSDRGIITVKLNDAQITTIDTYNASLTSGTSEVDSISVTLTGVQKLELQMNTKNASSTNYQLEFVSAAFIRTA